MHFEFIYLLQTGNDLCIRPLLDDLLSRLHQVHRLGETVPRDHGEAGTDDSPRGLSSLSGQEASQLRRVVCRNGPIVSEHRSLEGHVGHLNPVGSSQG